MKNLMGVIAIATATLITTSAFAENAADEKNANLARLWGTDTHASAQAANAPKPFIGISSVLVEITDTRGTDTRGGDWSGDQTGA